MQGGKRDMAGKGEMGEEVGPHVTRRSTDGRAAPAARTQPRTHARMHARTCSAMPTWLLAKCMLRPCHADRHPAFAVLEERSIE